MLSNFDLSESETNVDDKKIPLKPKPVKKGNINNENSKEESSNLVIQSK